jgi:hypothetical protein
MSIEELGDPTGATASGRVVCREWSAPSMTEYSLVGTASRHIAETRRARGSLTAPTINSDGCVIWSLTVSKSQRRSAG